MCSSIIVQNLGPLKNVSIDLSAEFSVIIGPQASGKSTLGKIIYFCKKIRDYAIEFVSNEEMFLSDLSYDDIYKSFLRSLHKKYLENFDFGKTEYGDFLIKYNYDENNFILIKLDNEKNIIFEFSREIEARLKSFFSGVREFNLDNMKREGEEWKFTFRDFWQRLEAQQFREKFLKDRVFHDDSEIIYVPAGRGIFSILADQLSVASGLNFGLPIIDFIKRVQAAKARFKKNLDKVVEDYAKTDREPVNNDDLQLAQDIIRKILKADYVNDTDGEKLYFDSNNWVRLIYGSSGQQEALWILLLMFSLILEHKKAFVILEEPEANVYPNAQLDIIKLIALTLNSTKSKFFITTHSPYIMTSANLLIHSGQVENKIINDNGDSIIPKQLRINPEVTAAYKITDSKNEIHNIRDQETGMFDASEIDTISDIIGEATDKLIDLEIEHECRE